MYDYLVPKYEQRFNMLQVTLFARFEFFNISINEGQVLVHVSNPEILRLSQFCIFRKFSTVLHSSLVCGTYSVFVKFNS